MRAEDLWAALERVLDDPTRPWRAYDSYLNPDPGKLKQGKQKTS